MGTHTETGMGSTRGEKKKKGKDEKDRRWTMGKMAGEAKEGKLETEAYFSCSLFFRRCAMPRLGKKRKTERYWFVSFRRVVVLPAFRAFEMETMKIMRLPPRHLFESVLRQCPFHHPRFADSAGKPYFFFFHAF